MFFRLEVENFGKETVDYCQAYLTEVFYFRDPVQLGSMRLTWASANPPFVVELIKNVRRHLDIIFVRENGSVSVCTEGWPNNQADFFARHGEYVFKIVISGKGMATLEPKTYRLNVTGDWQTTTFREELGRSAE